MKKLVVVCILSLCASGALASEDRTERILNILERLEARLTKLENEQTRSEINSLKREVRAPRSKAADSIKPATVETARESYASARPSEMVESYRRPAWTGPYAGASFGVGFSQPTGSFTQNATSSFGAAAPSTGGFTTGDDPGAVIDLFAGYDWQAATNAVFGIQVEGSLGAMTSEAQVTQFGPGFFNTFPTDVSLSWMVSALARVGWLLSDQTLIYAVGGWSYAQYADDSTSKNYGVNGPLVGAGFEQRITPSWRWRAEYRFTHFGDTTETSTNASTGFTTTRTTTVGGDVHLIRLGLAHQFGVQ